MTDWGSIAEEESSDHPSPVKNLDKWEKEGWTVQRPEDDDEEDKQIPSDRGRLSQAGINAKRWDHGGFEQLESEHRPRKGGPRGRATQRGGGTRGSRNQHNFARGRREDYAYRSTNRSREEGARMPSAEKSEEAEYLKERDRNWGEMGAERRKKREDDQRRKEKKKEDRPLYQPPRQTNFLTKAQQFEDDQNRLEERTEQTQHRERIDNKGTRFPLNKEGEPRTQRDGSDRNDERRHRQPSSNKSGVRNKAGRGRTYEAEASGEAPQRTTMWARKEHQQEGKGEDEKQEAKEGDGAEHEKEEIRKEKRAEKSRQGRTKAAGEKAPTWVPKNSASAETNEPKGEGSDKETEQRKATPNDTAEKEETKESEWQALQQREPRKRRPAGRTETPKEEPTSSAKWVAKTPPPSPTITAETTEKESRSTAPERREEPKSQEQIAASQETNKE